MKIKDSVVLVTGSNRGIGKSYIAALLQRGAKKVYAGMRDTGWFETLAREWPEADRQRVEPLILDITNEGHIRSAVARAGDVTVLINNAGIARFAGLIAAENLDPARQEKVISAPRWRGRET